MNIYKVAITGIEKKSEGSVAVQGAKLSDGSALASRTFDMDKDCVYIGMNDDKQEGVTGSSLDQIALAEETTTAGTYYLNAYIVVENSGDENILAIIYDADNNRLDGEKTVTSAGIVADTYSVDTPATVTTVNGLSATVTSDKTRVSKGEVITYTVKVTGTATEASKITMTAGTHSTAAGVTVSGDGWTVASGVAKVEAGKGAGTVKFTVTAGAGDVGAPTFTIAAQ